MLREDHPYKRCSFFNTVQHKIDIKDFSRTEVSQIEGKFV